jgi:hypothetical protein
MTYSYTVSSSATFTITNAKNIASKVATDLKRIQRFYGEPSDESIVNYESEIIEFLKAGYLDTVTYGFKKDGKWIEPTLKYTAFEIGEESDSDPGRIKPNANIMGASFSSYLTYNLSWYKLSQEKQKSFKDQLPFQRTGASEPGIAGYLSKDSTYYSGGRGLNRSILRSFS